MIIPIRPGKTVFVGGNSNDNLLWLLHPVNSQDIQTRMGAERRAADDGTICRTVAFWGGGRYLYQDDNGQIIGGLQYVSDKEEYRLRVIVNIYVRRDWRRKGIATELVKRAKWDSKRIVVDNHLTEDGAKFFGVTEYNRIRVVSEKIDVL